MLFVLLVYAYFLQSALVLLGLVKMFPPCIGWSLAIDQPDPWEDCKPQNAQKAHDQALFCFLLVADIDSFPGAGHGNVPGTSQVLVAFLDSVSGRLEEITKNMIFPTTWEKLPGHFKAKRNIDQPPNDSWQNYKHGSAHPAFRRKARRSW